MSDPLTNDLASLRIQKEEAPPSSNGLWVALVVVAVLAVAGVLGYRAVSERIFKTDVRATTIELVSPAQSSIDLTSTGYVVAQSTSKIAARIAGRIAQVAIVEGEHVKKGQLLARLDDADLKIAVVAAKARLETAHASLADLQRQLTREQRLLAAGVSQRATVDDLDAKVKVQEASTRAAEADYQAATMSLAYATITSPISGTVISKPRQVGEYVGFGLDPTVAEISDFDTLMIETDVPEGRLAKVKIGGPTEIVLDAYPDTRFRGEVDEIVPKVDRAKATVVVKVKFVDPHQGALPDMAARVSFLQAALDAASLKQPPKLVVPASAVTERGGGPVVFKLEDGKVRMMPVVLGPKFGSGYELQSGPESGTRVVADPPSTLVDGAPVKERID